MNLTYNSGEERKLILLVDDDEAHQYALGKHLEESGFAVLHAFTGEATLKLANERLPDVILLDIHLPDQDGFTVCERLKANPLTTPFSYLRNLGRPSKRTSGRCRFISKLPY